MTMVTVPGLSHLSVLVPEDSTSNATVSARPDAGNTSKRRTALARVTVAIEVAARVRPQRHLRPLLFDGLVRRHIAARRHTLAATAHVRLTSLHLTDAGDLFGVVRIGQAIHGFSGRLIDDRLAIFRLL